MSSPAMGAAVHTETRHVVYDDKCSRQFVAASAFWGLIGMLVGLLAALQLGLPQLNFDVPC